VLADKNRKYEGKSVNRLQNGSKIALVDVISFLYVSLGISTVQLRDRLGSRRICACSEAGFCTKMATVLEEYTIEKQRSVVSFL
jgi:hypothetical protein